MIIIFNGKIFLPLSSAEQKLPKEQLLKYAIKWWHDNKIEHLEMISIRPLKPSKAPTQRS